MSSWFQNFASSAKHFADELADSLMAQANAAQEEIAAEQNKIRQEKEKEKMQATAYSLPWEPNDEAHDILTQPLMASILLLSHHESNFTSSIPDAPFPPFDFDAYIPLAMELMKYDAQLVLIHSKLSPKMQEEKFWLHYYQRCMLLRYKCGMEGPDGVTVVAHINVDDVVNVVDGPTPSASPVVPASPITARDTSPVIVEDIPRANESPVLSPPEPSEEELAAAAEQARREREEELLRAEVEAELAGHADTDYDFSSEFEELGTDDIDDTDDAELEAQIARELMEDS